MIGAHKGCILCFFFRFRSCSFCRFHFDIKYVLNQHPFGQCIHVSCIHLFVLMLKAFSFFFLFWNNIEMNNKMLNVMLVKRAHFILFECPLGNRINSILMLVEHFAIISLAFSEYLVGWNVSFFSPPEKWSFSSELEIKHIVSIENGINLF